MAAEHGLLSSTHHQEFPQQHYYMWNPNQIIPQDQDQLQDQDDDDDSWEVRAFEQDSNNITWPPRSYSCTFCTREFRSAQALGGHMNVHRRDRARLNQAPPPLLQSTTTNSRTTTTTTFLIPSQEIVTNGGLCFVYSLPTNPIRGVSTPVGLGLNTFIKNPPTSSNFATIDSASSNNNLFPSCPPSNKSRPWAISSKEINSNVDCKKNSPSSSAIEELDLELRLGPR